MTETVITVLYYLVLFDAVSVNMMAWAGANHWWQRAGGPLAHLFPLRRGWTSYYLLLVLVIGYLLVRLEWLWLPW